MTEQYKKSGYLNSDFKIFFLSDNKKTAFDFHYHDFHKLLVILGGDISYAVEGREYKLCPGDIILIRAGEIHRPVIHNTIPYTRMIVYISNRFFQEMKQEHCDLFSCYKKAQQENSNLVRFSPAFQTRLSPIITDIRDSFKNKSEFTQLYQKAKFIEFLILFNEMITREPSAFFTAGSVHPVILDILNYINDNLTDDLSIDTIANHVFLNRSYIMHLFKKETGCTIARYITEKRLFLANHMITQGTSATEACYQSGFKSYTTFYQAYKTKYKHSPKEILHNY